MLPSLDMKAGQRLSYQHCPLPFTLLADVFKYNYTFTKSSHMLLTRASHPSGKVSMPGWKNRNTTIKSFGKKWSGASDERSRLAAFPEGNFYLRLRHLFGIMFDNTNLRICSRLADSPLLPDRCYFGR